MLKGKEVTLTDMLYCRERRASLQTELIQTYHCPVLSFCMNIPGPVKTTEQIQQAFEQGVNELIRQFEAKQIPVLYKIAFHETTGDELLWAVNYPASELKEITVSIEENHPRGRLFDMDVIDVDGKKISRGTYRKCLICGCQAQECASSRRHTVAQMQEAIQLLLQ